MTNFGFSALAADAKKNDEMQMGGAVLRAITVQ